MLNAPAPSVSPIFDETIKRTNFRFDNYENLHVAEYVGAVATPQLTTILAITGSVVNELDGLEGNARNFGIQTFAQATGDATAGVRIIMADETMISDGASGYLSQVKVNLRRQDVADSVTEDGSFQSSTKIKGLSQYLQVAEPGAYFLSLTLPNSAAPTNFSLAVLPNRVTLLILHRRANNSIRILGFAPSSLPEPDFRSLEVKMRNLRQLDLLQRYYLSDRLDSEQTLEEAEDLLKDAGDLLYAKWIDPLAGCLGGYTLLKLDKADKIGEAAANMVRDYAELSDSHVLQAEFLKSQRRPAKKKIVDTYLAALDRGIPVFAEGLQRLAGAIDEYKIEHLLAARVLEIYQNRVRNSLWTIWT